MKEKTPHISKRLYTLNVNNKNKDEIIRNYKNYKIFPYVSLNNCNFVVCNRVCALSRNKK